MHSLRWLPRSFLQHCSTESGMRYPRSVRGLSNNFLFCWVLFIVSRTWGGSSSVRVFQRLLILVVEAYIRVALMRGVTLGSAWICFGYWVGCPCSFMDPTHLLRLLGGERTSLVFSSQRVCTVCRCSWMFHLDHACQGLASLGFSGG